MNGLPQPQNRIPIEPEEDTGKKDTFDVLGNLSFSKILGFALILVACFIGWILVTQGADILENLVKHIMNLFRRGRIYPYPNEYFIQLLLIAVFIGWAINRIRKR